MSAAPELSPFEVETLRVLALPPDVFDEFCGAVDDVRRTRVRVPKATWAAYALERLGYVDLAWDITDAGRATLLALGVT